MKNLIILGIIFLLGVVLRFYNINTNPPSLNWDEAAYGYNAYSLGIDGRDEFGRFLPLDYLESYGDFKPVIYAYLDIVPIKIFGLTPFAVRFPSAFLGALTVVLTYFLVLEIFYKSKEKEKIGQLSAFVLAISPWHIMLSRAAFEANVATFFIILGTYFYLLFVNRYKRALILSAIFFTLSIYTFNTARLVGPLLILVLSVIFWKRLVVYKKTVAIAFVVGIIMISPTLRFLFSPQAALRFKEVNIFSDLNIIKISNQEIKNDSGNIASKIVHNRRVLYAKEYLSHYFDNLSPNFLFIRGDGNPRFSTQDTGQLYLWDFPFILAGAFMLLRKREGYYFLIPIIILIGIIPAASARETPHALRIENSLPYFQILVAYGFWQVLSVFKHRRLFQAIFATLLFINTAYFLHGLFLHYPREYSSEWQYPYKDSVAYVYQSADKYQTISTTNRLGRPYIYYLFFTKYPPSEFRKNAKVKRDAFGFVDVKSFDKYYFSSDVASAAKKRNVLYVDLSPKVPNSAHILQKFNFLDGSEGLSAYTL